MVDDDERFAATRWHTENTQVQSRRYDSRNFQTKPLAKFSNYRVTTKGLVRTCEFWISNNLNLIVLIKTSTATYVVDCDGSYVRTTVKLDFLKHVHNHRIATINSILWYCFFISLAFSPEVVINACSFSTVHALSVHSFVRRVYFFINICDLVENAVIITQQLNVILNDIENIANITTLLCGIGYGLWFISCQRYIGATHRRQSSLSSQCSCASSQDTPISSN